MGGCVACDVAQVCNLRGGRQSVPRLRVAGGGIKGGLTFGATDDMGYRVVEGKVHIHDLHATILHQLGINLLKLTSCHLGRDYRLTDVYGNVVREIVA